MIQYTEARNRIRKLAEQNAVSFRARAKPHSTETEFVTEIMGRILATPAIGREAIPPFDNSSMDGFAIRAEWVRDASPSSPVEIPILGTVFAGETCRFALSPQKLSGVEIMTGAPLPEGADAVVKIEEVEVITPASTSELSLIRVRAPLKPDENIRRQGTDFAAGQRVAEAGTRISAEQILAFATVGISEVSLLPRPRIAIISTGNELLDRIEDPLQGGMIRNSTAPYLLSALPLYGAEGRFFGTVKDEPARFLDQMKAILAERPDVILTTGAVSKGKLDFVPDALRELGAEVLFHGVAIRPGKPLLLARLPEGPAVFAIPGNPLSTAVALRFFVYPYLCALQGLPEEKAEPVELAATTAKAEGLRCFWKASLPRAELGRLAQVTSLSGQESYRVSSLLPANRWLILPESGSSVPAQSIVQTVPLYPNLASELGNDASLGHGAGCC